MAAVRLLGVDGSLPGKLRPGQRLRLHSVWGEGQTQCGTQFQSGHTRDQSCQDSLLLQLAISLCVCRDTGKDRPPSLKGG